MSAKRVNSSTKPSCNSSSPRSASAGFKANTAESKFAEFQSLKVDNFREINLRKQKEIVMLQKLMNSIRNSETREFILLEEKYQAKKAEVLKQVEEKIGKVREKIERVEGEREGLRFKLRAKSGIDVLAEIVKMGNQQEVLSQELFAYKMSNSSLGRIHADCERIVAGRKDCNLAAGLAKSILEMQQKRIKVGRDCEKLRGYREDLQKSLRDKV